MTDLKRIQRWCKEHINGINYELETGEHKPEYVAFWKGQIASYQAVIDLIDEMSKDD